MTRAFPKQGPVSREDILRVIPHRDPFLLIDHVVSWNETKLIGELRVPTDSPWLPGHFPGNPVVPGVLLAEGCAQASCLHAALIAGMTSTQALLTEIVEARFRRMVLPGELIRYEVLPTKRRGPFIWFDASVFVGKETALTLKIGARIG